MNAEEVKKRYDSTIGRFVVAEKDNPLCGVRVAGYGGVDYANVHLSVRSFLGDRDKNTRFRFAVRQYFSPALKGNEHLRCWLGVGRDPRVDLYLARKEDVLSFDFCNEEVVELVRHWCEEAGVEFN